jgi:hypothetical protein
MNRLKQRPASVRVARARPAVIAVAVYCAAAGIAVARHSAAQGYDATQSATSTTPTVGGPNAAKSLSTTNTASSRAVLLAKKWIDAVRAGDVRAVLAIIDYPFALRDTASEGTCASSTLETTNQASFMLRCLTTDPVLMEDLHDNPELLTVVLSRRQLPNWAKQWRNELRPGLIPVQLTVFGNGVNFFFIVLVGDTNVHGVWKHATFDPN